MASNKIRVYVPGDEVQYKTVDVINHLITSQVDILTEQELEADPSLGKDIRVAFWCGKLAKRILSDYEKGLLPSLKLICNHGVGVNHMPFDKLRECGLLLTNTPAVLSDATADMAMGLMLASGRQFRRGMDWAMKMSTEEKKAIWSSHELGQDICYATLGIVGMGSIGYKIAQRAKAFNMNVVYHNRTKRSSEDEQAVGALFYNDLHSMLKVADFVIISCPLTTDTTGLFKKVEFEAMKPSAHLINIARGSIVDTDALVDALKSKQIYAAALDVTDPEPMPDDHPLLELDNVIVVPHWGSATIQTRGKMVQLMIDNAKAFLDGKPLLTEVKF